MAIDGSDELARKKLNSLILDPMVHFVRKINGSNAVKV